MSVGKITRYGLPFSNVVATGVATNNITPGRTIENVQLKLGGTALTKAMLTLIRLKANGKTFFECDGTTLDKLNNYRGGSTADVAFLDCPFAERVGDVSAFDRLVGAFDTSQGIANITSEVTITGATAPTLLAIIHESAPQNQSNQQGQQKKAPYAGVMSKLLRYPYNVATGGTLPITVPFGAANGAIIKRLHVQQNTGNMTGATVKQDGLVIHESIAAENSYEQKRWARVPQANLYTIDFVVEGNMARALDTRDCKSLEWLLAFSAADSGYVLVEYLDTLGNL